MTVATPTAETPARRKASGYPSPEHEDAREKFRMITFDPDAHTYYTVDKKKAKKTCSVVHAADNAISIAGEEKTAEEKVEKTAGGNAVAAEQEEGKRSCPLERATSKCSNKSKLSAANNEEKSENESATPVQKKHATSSPSAKKRQLQRQNAMIDAMEKSNINYGATNDANNFNFAQLGGGFHKKSKGCLACKSSLHCYMFFVATLCTALSVFFLVAVPFQVKSRYAERDFVRGKRAYLTKKQKAMSKVWENPKPQPMMDKVKKAWTYIAPYRGSDNGIYQIDYSMTEILGNVVELGFCVGLAVLCYLLMTKRFESHVESKRNLFRAQLYVALSYMVALAVQACVGVAQVGPRVKEGKKWYTKIVAEKKVAMAARNFSSQKFQQVLNGVLKTGWTAHDVRSWQQCVLECNTWIDAYKHSPRLYSAMESQIARIIMFTLFKVAILGALLFVSRKAFAKFKQGRAQKRAEQKKAQKQMERTLEFHHAQNALIAQMNGKMHFADAMSADGNSSCGLHSYATHGPDSMPIQGSRVWKNPDGSMGVSFTNPILAGMDMSTINGSNKNVSRQNTPINGVIEEEGEEDCSDVCDLESN